MPPHRPWPPAATERRLCLARRSSSLLIRRSASSHLSIPAAGWKSSRPKGASGAEARRSLFSQWVRRGRGLPRVEEASTGNGERQHAFAIVGVLAGGDSLFLPGLEHAPGHFSDEAARDEAFAVGAEIISESGNDVTFAGGQSFQPGVRNFFGGLGVSKELFLAGHGMEFGFRGPWAKSAHADTIWFHLFGKAFGEKQIKSFCGSVGRNIRNSLERSG